MSTPILATKLFIPLIQPKTVLRPHLIKRLNDCTQCRLTLVSASAGFGKTTLISEWVAGCKQPVAWLSLDEEHEDPARFLTYFIAALQTIAADIGVGLLAMLQSPQPPSTDFILMSLLNEITTIPDSFILVLDNYHVPDGEAVNSILTFFLENMPPLMHLVIATREDPHLSLARLRGRGQLIELRAADLRFTLSEASGFLNQMMGLDLSTDDIMLLATRTEGWITGLQLAAISMQGHKNTTGFIESFTGSHHFVLDYLIEEVLKQQSESIQSFLLRTSILDRMCGSLCDAVLLKPSGTGQKKLRYLEQSNMFIIPLDNERRWYRYHHLFSELLRQRLSQTQQEEIPVLHQRASEWYEKHGFPDEAIGHAMSAEDFDRAVHLIEKVVEAVWMRGENTKLQHWLDGLPVDLVFSKPHLCIFYAWDLFAAGQHGAAERSLQAAEQVLDSISEHGSETSQMGRGQLPDTDRMKLLGRVATIRSFLASHRGDVPEIIQYSRKALEYLPEQDLTWRSTAAIVLGDAHGIKGEVVAAYRTHLEALELSKAAGNIYMILIASLKVAVSLRQQGRLQQSIEICQQQMQLANKNGMSEAVEAGCFLAVWGEVLVELNDLDGAINLAGKGVELTERGGDVAMLSWSYLCLIRILFSRGNMACAEEIIQKMENVALEYNVPPWITDLLITWQIRTLLVQDKLDAASQWVGEHWLDPDEEPTYLHEMEYIVVARVLIAQHRLDETTRLLQRLLELAETGGRTTRMIEILMLQALTFQDGGDLTRAMTALERALSLAEPGGFIRIFVDEGLRMANLLRKAATSGISRDYAQRLLAAFENDEQRNKSKSGSPISPSSHLLVEQLSQRELEVLGLIAKGLLNREISERLFISLDTVKGHNRNIYSKLGVRNRTEAISKARSLNILLP